MAPYFDLTWRPQVLLVHTTKRANIDELTGTFDMQEKSTINPLPDGCYALTPITTSEVEVPRLLDVVIVNDLLTDKPDRIENVKDFPSSGQVYEFLKQKKIKVLQDDFSYARNQRLYAAFNLVETRWRILVMADNKLAKLIDRTNPEAYRSKNIDHKAAQYNLSEFYENFLLAPASDQFVVQEWAKSGKTDDELLSVKRLRMLDELKFPLTEDELKSLREIRNQSMHFRVTTLEEYTSAITLVNRYIKDVELRDITNAVSRTIDQRLMEFSQLLQVQRMGNLPDVLSVWNQSNLTKATLINLVAPIVGNDNKGADRQQRRDG